MLSLPTVVATDGRVVPTRAASPEISAAAGRDLIGASKPGDELRDGDLSGDATHLQLREEALHDGLGDALVLGAQDWE